jgi:cytochrome b561
MPETQDRTVMAPVTPAKYASLTRLLHWVTGLMVLATIPIGVIMLQDGLARSTQNLLFILHKNGGVILFLLVVLRILWRFATPAPTLPAHIPAWQARAAKFVQSALYLLLLVMAASGYVRVRAGGFPVEMLDALGVQTLIPRSDALAQTAKSIHATLRFPLAALIVLHIAAAMKHLVARDGVFGQIWPPVGRG